MLLQLRLSRLDPSIFAVPNYSLQPSASLSTGKTPHQKKTKRAWDCGAEVTCIAHFHSAGPTFHGRTTHTRHICLRHQRASAFCCCESPHLSLRAGLSRSPARRGPAQDGKRQPGVGCHSAASQRGLAGLPRLGGHSEDFCSRKRERARARGASRGSSAGNDHRHRQCLTFKISQRSVFTLSRQH